MEDKYVAFESIPKEENEIAINNTSSGDHGWQKVTYAKRHRKVKPSAAVIGGDSLANGNSKIANGGDNVFRSLEQQSEDRRRRIVEAQREAYGAANGVSNGRSKVRSDDDDESDSDSDEIAAGNGKTEVAAKKPKVKKPKKPKVTVAEASAKIDANELSAFLAEISESYELQQELRLMRFADYFGRAFTAVSSAQFPWMKLFRESTVAKMVDVPLSSISEDVYKVSIDWINQQSVEALGSFVLWSLDSLLVEFAAHQTSAKGSKKAVQHVSSKSQVGIFVAIGMVLRRKPDALIHVLPKLREDSRYQGQDKIPLLVWITLQASQGDLAVGLFVWARILLPLIGGKTSNPQTRDLVLQLVERILSTPKARTILVNGAVRKGERLIPPSSFEILMRVTFPPSSARIKATERFEAIYPTLKEVSLAGSQGSKAMKQVSQQILIFAIKDAGENTPELAREASGVFIWCLTQNADNFKQWDKLYEDNIEASVAVLKKLSEQWKDISVKLTPLDPMREALKSFRNMNEKADGDKHALFKEADKYCKALLGKLSRGNGCLKSMAFIVGIGALVAGASVLAPNLESFDWNKISEAISSAL